MNKRNRLVLFFVFLIVHFAFAYDLYDFKETLDEGNLVLAKKIIASGLDVNSRDERGMSLLALALSESDDESLVVLLVNKGADVYSEDKEGETILHYASEKGYVWLVKKILAGKPEEVSSLVNRKNQYDMTPFFYAIAATKPEVVDLFIKNGANVANYADFDDTPLHLAAQTGSVYLVKLLLGLGSKINSYDKEGYTPLHRAVLNGNADVVKILLDNGAGVNDPVLDGNDGGIYKDEISLDLAVNKADCTLIKLFAERGADLSRSINYKAPDEEQMGKLPYLIYALVNDQIEAAALLIDRGADINKTSQSGKYNGIPALHIAIENCFSNYTSHDKYNAKFLKYKDIVMNLVYKGADINARVIHKLDYYSEAKKMNTAELVIELEKNLEEYGYSENNKKKPCVEIIEVQPVKNETNEFFEAIKNDDLKKIKAMIGSGFDIHSQKKIAEGNYEYEWDALQYAVYCGKKDAIDYLAGKTENYKSGINYVYPALAANNFEIFKYMLNKVGQGSEKINGLLSYAIDNQNPDALDYIIKKGAMFENKYLKRAFKTGRAGLYISMLGISPYDNEIKNFYNAIFRKDLKKIESMIKKGYDVDSNDKTIYTPLCFASLLGYDDVVRMLIENGANPGHEQDPVLFGCDEMYDGYSPVYWAVFNGNLSTVKILVESGASVDVSDYMGGTLFHLAVEKGYAKIVDFLLEKKAKLTITNWLYWIVSPVHLAAQKGNTDVMKVFLKYGIPVDFNAKGLSGNIMGITELSSPLFYAIENNHFDIVKLLVESGAKTDRVWEGETVMHYATEYSNMDIIRYLIEKGAGIDAVNSTGFTPLYNVVWRNDLEAVKMLCSNKADVNKVQIIEGKKTTLLHKACELGFFEIAELLIGSGAKVNVVDNDGFTPAYYAVLNNDSKIIALLAKNKADFNVDKIKTEDGNKSLFDICTSYTVWKILKDNNAKQLK